MYSQQSDPWGPTRLGVSQWTMRDSGCLVTCVANALLLAGYGFTPGNVVDSFNAHGTFTDDSYVVSGVPKPGLLYFGKVGNSYAMFHPGSGPYQFREVKWGANFHWVLEYQGVFYDPWDSSTHFTMPSNYLPTGQVLLASIDQAQVEAITASAPAPAFWVQALVGLNVRTSPHITPNDIDAPFHLKEGDEVRVSAYVQGDDVNGNDQWCFSALHRLYFSAYYTKQIPNPSVTQAS